jgi:hypothetical protein
LQAAVKAQLDHPAQSPAVPGKNLVQCRLIAATRQIEQARCLAGIALHQDPHSSINSESECFLDRSNEKSRRSIDAEGRRGPMRSIRPVRLTSSVP